MRLRSKVLLAGGGLIICIYLTSLAYVWQAAREDQRHAADAIVVLGAAQYNGRPSPVLKARLDHALDLWAAGLAARIVVTGGTAVGDTESEAIVERRYLLGRGMADSEVMVVPEGKNTDETVTAVATWGATHGVRDVLLVSDAFHLARLRVVAQRHGLRGWTSPAPGSPIAGRREWGYLLEEGVKLPVAYLAPAAP